MHSGSTCLRARWLAVVALGSLYLFAAVVYAANRLTPEVVNIRAFAIRSDRGLELLVRVPLAAVKDVQFPLTGRDSHLDLVPLRSMLPGAAQRWIGPTLEITSGGTPLPMDVTATRLAIASDRAFESHGEAAASFAAPALADNEVLFWESVWFDIRYHVEAGAADDLAIRPEVADLGMKVSTALTVVAGDAPLRTFSFEGDPGLIYLDPGVGDALGQFATRGARFIVTSTELLLVLLCLALPFRRYREFLPAAAAFTATFIAALGVSRAGLATSAIWFAPLVDALAAAMILLAALANVAARVTPRRRALLALAAGAVFGAVAATHLDAIVQFGGAHPMTAALAFAAGAAVTIGAVLALLIPALAFLFSWARSERIERLIVSALAADTAWMWLSDRWSLFRRIPFESAFDGIGAAGWMTRLAVLTLLGGIVWLVNEWLKTKPFADADIGGTTAAERGA